MEKSPEAFRTISEVADWLGVPTHVLRFWESRFAQIKPVKRAGGRRYYRPSDMALIGGIKRLLHDDGMTIRGAQKLLREKGVKYVASLSRPIDGATVVDDDEVIEATAVDLSAAPPAPANPTETAPAGETPPVVAPEPDTAGIPEVETAQAEPDPEPSDPAPAPEPAVEPDEAPAAPALQAPDVPDTDPEDDDTAFPGTPGLAARLRVADKAYLTRNRDALWLLKDKLPARATA